MIQGIHHIAIISSSEESVEFYKKLGFEEIFRKEREYDKVVLLSGYGIQLEIFVDSNHPAHETNPERIGIRHLALKVDSCEEISKVFECTPIKKDWLGLNYCNTTDPDGIVVELHE